MTSHRPYLLRALNEWILDNGRTPYLIVTTVPDDVIVPRENVENDRIVLNISPVAVRNLTIGNERIEFDGRFGGRPFRVSVPIGAVLAVYAKETGEGMAFEPESRASHASPQGPASGGHLRVVK